MADSEKRGETSGHKRSYRLLVYVAVLLAVAIVFLSSAISEALEVKWVSRSVDESVAQGPISIGIDEADNTHMIYQTTEGIIYATDAGGEWSRSVIASNRTLYERRMPMVMDGSGAVHVAYIVETENVQEYELWYATNLGGSWAKTLIDKNVSSEASLALDSHLGAHVAYSKYGNLTYATNSDGGWESYPLLSWGWFGSTSFYQLPWMTDIALDSDDNIHIAFIFDYYTLGYVTNSGGTWNTTTIMGGLDFSSKRPSVIIDSSGFPNLFWYSFRSIDNSYAVFHGVLVQGVWSYETITGVGSSQYSTMAIVIDEQGDIHLAFNTGVSLAYLEKLNGQWTSPYTISRYVESWHDYVPWVLEVSLAVDSHGHARIPRTSRASVAYFTDDVTFRDRLDAVFSYFLIGIAGIAIIAVAIMAQKRKGRTQRAWDKVLSGVDRERPS